MKTKLITSLLVLATSPVFASSKIACVIVKEQANKSWSQEGPTQLIDYKNESSRTLYMDANYAVTYSLDSRDNRLAITVLRRVSPTEIAGSSTANGNLIGGVSLMDLNAKVGAACSNPVEIP